MLVEIAFQLGTTPFKAAALLDEADEMERKFNESGRAGLRPDG